MGHGGSRPGAGRPEGGISQVQRCLQRAIVRGLALAGREKGLQGSEEEVATESTARIVSDMILAGQGADVIKLMAISGKTGDDGGKGDSGSRILDAIKRLPGANVPEQSQAAGTGQGALELAGPAAPATSEPESAGGQPQPFFSPQRVLPVVLPADGGAPVTPPAARTPHPPGARAPSPYALGTENFEKSESEAEPDDTVSAETNQRRANA